ncbi:MAG: DUF4163 domain-containing protein [Methylobacillus sp.]|nr:DUF4163 domain-containing protein [Methylobacillus sp.]
MKKSLVVTAALAAALLSAQASAAPIAEPGREISVETPGYTFYYSYPAAAGRIPALKKWLDEDAVSEQKEIATAADADKDHGKFESSVIWEVVTELPGWLSLTGAYWAYVGGAHGGGWTKGLLWDKTENREVEALDLFTSPKALLNVVNKLFCAELERQYREKNGSTEGYYGCPNPVDPKSGVVMILGSSDHAHFTRIGFLLATNVAGPYVAGEFEVTLPVTPDVLAAVRPEYRASFAAKP